MILNKSSNVILPSDRLFSLYRTKAFIDKLANGVNPMTGEMIPDYELINNVRVSRCLFYVSDLLRQVIENGGVQRQSKGKKLPFTITHEELTRYIFPGNPPYAAFNSIVCFSVLCRWISSTKVFNSSDCILCSSFAACQHYSSIMANLSTLPKACKLEFSI